jgi:hypothetical protein
VVAAGVLESGSVEQGCHYYLFGQIKPGWAIADSCVSAGHGGGVVQDTIR